MTTALTRGGLIPEWTLGDRLRKAREAAGLEQQQLAQMIGVARNTISNAEKGKVAPRQIVINQWSLATGVPVQWLQTGQAPRPNDPDEGLPSEVRHQGLEPRTRWLSAYRPDQRKCGNVYHLPRVAPIRRIPMRAAA